MTPEDARQTPVVGLSMPELAYLLHLVPTTERSLTHERLRLLAEPDDDVLRSGLSALAARGGVGVDGGVIRPTAENAAIAAILATADRWAEIGVSAGGGSEIIHVVAGSGAVLVANPRPLGVLEFAGIRPGVPIEVAVMQMIAPLAGADAPGRLVVNAVGFDTSPNAVAGVRRHRSWRLVRWDGPQPLQPGSVFALASGASPEPGWSAIGDGDPADLLSWAAVVVGAGAPAVGGTS